MYVHVVIQVESVINSLTKKITQYKKKCTITVNNCSKVVLQGRFLTLPFCIKSNRFLIIFVSIFCLQGELSLYDPSILLKLDFHRSPAKFNPFISAAAPGEPWMKVRPLQDGDYNRGFLQLLSQLTSVGDVSLPQFLSKWMIMGKMIKKI